MSFLVTYILFFEVLNNKNSEIIQPGSLIYL